MKRRDEMLQESQNRISELEDYQEQLEQQQTEYRNQSNIDKSKIEVEFCNLKENLEKSSEIIENQTKQINELDSALKESNSEIRLRSEKISELENSCKKLVGDVEAKSKLIETLKGEIKKRNARLDEFAEKNRQAETKLLDANKLYQDAARKAANLDQEVIAHSIFFCISSCPPANMITT